jgi:hypothetical protein
MRNWVADELPDGHCVEDDTLHDVADLLGIEVGGRGVQVLVSHESAVELGCHRMSRVIENLRVV